MAELLKEDVVQQFSQYVKQGDVNKNIALLYKVQAGKPNEPVQEVFELTGNGRVNVSRHEPLESIPAQKTSLDIDKIETLEYFRETALGVENLLAQGEGPFLPDSLLASITIRIGSEEATFYFLASEKQRVWQKKPIAPELLETMKRIARISNHAIGKESEEGDE